MWKSKFFVLYLLGLTITGNLRQSISRSRSISLLRTKRKAIIPNVEDKSNSIRPKVEDKNTSGNRKSEISLNFESDAPIDNLLNVTILQNRLLWSKNWFHHTDCETVPKSYYRWESRFAAPVDDLRKWYDNLEFFDTIMFEISVHIIILTQVSFVWWSDMVKGEGRD